MLGFSAVHLKYNLLPYQIYGLSAALLHVSGMLFIASRPLLTLQKFQVDLRK